ncbi:MAG TPA: 3-oxoacyl-[acyl-carrier-protein] synthase III C-terminal domain-containing protein [Candidatus Dormibacteraeota bacterium]|nr:3-oxoacyl-[acyl-carrier-protein] synthase III C-terminal domain-containing protein [Candidatus Dormibacteraeota bacterium]
MASGSKGFVRDGGAGTIASVATALPAYTMARDEVKRYMREVFALDERKLRALYAVVDNTRVETRHCIFPLDYFIKPRPLAQLTREYREHAVSLGRQAACDALSAAGLRPADIDLFITVSCTGVIIPSLDAYLINDMGFRSDVRRLPITELGCAAGAAALGHAWHFLRGCPEGRVLALSVELPTLTFQRNDLSQANLISCALFGDGAAAAVITGEPQAGPRMMAAESYLFPHSLDAMGFDLRETGFHIILAREVPDLIRSRIKQLVGGFLERHHRRQEEIAAWVLHPGGQKLLSYIEQELGLDSGQTQPSWDVLRDYGNLSSASVLFVLKEWLNKEPMPAGASGLLVGFGPGFSAEMVLLEWRN